MSGSGQDHRGGSSRGGVPLSIGLVNNASDSELRATEVQFLRMLRAASRGFDLSFRLFNCPVVPRSAAALDASGKPYADIEELFDTPLDALVVTGMEPSGRTLLSEPIWDDITRLVDWAGEHSVPVIWSCLAAHAAVLYLDGLDRSLLPKKLSGVFACNLVQTDHLLATGLPARWANPHSRLYDVSRAGLLANGYQILSHSDEAGVDVFLKEQCAPFLFFQGHPEYAADTLLSLYRRDVNRFLVGDSNDFPSAPRNYFDPATEAALAAAGDRARQTKRGRRDIEAISSLIPAAVTRNLWEQSAVTLCANWLTLVARSERRTRRRGIVSARPFWSRNVTGGASLIQ